MFLQGPGCVRQRERGDEGTGDAATGTESADDVDGLSRWYLEYRSWGFRPSRPQPGHASLSGNSSVWRKASSLRKDCETRHSPNIEREYGIAGWGQRRRPEPRPRYKCAARTSKRGGAEAWAVRGFDRAAGRQRSPYFWTRTASEGKPLKLTELPLCVKAKSLTASPSPAARAPA